MAFGLASLRHTPTTEPDGINLIRSRQTNGMSIYANLVEQVLRFTGRPVQTLDFEELGVPDSAPRAIHPVTISAITPGHIAFAELQYPRAFSPKRTQRAAVFMWDVDVIPARLRAGFRFLDQLWTASSMGAEYLSKATSKPVHYFPAPILEPKDVPSGMLRRQLDVGDAFLVAYQFDIGSSARRKNAAAAIDIYKKAFPTSSNDTHLLLKCTRGNPNSPEWGELEEARGSRQDITLVNDYWEKELVDAMYSDLDCYLSPHRSEGYGLTVAEAMAHGIYVIATAHGGPVDVMDSNYSGMIPCRLVEVGKDPIYPAHARWAEPDIDAGADLLREAYANRDATRAKASLGRRHVLDTFTIQRAAEWINDHLTS